MNICELRKAAFHKYFSHLNEPQQQAVFHVGGQVLVLAGAGSGKTTAIINRIVNMVLFGMGYDHCDRPITEESAAYLEDYLQDKTEANLDYLIDALAYYPVFPWKILAITFTNKAAGELKDRLANTLEPETAQKIHASTFHSACVRMLRESIPLLGYRADFTIYDTDDSKRLMKNVMAELNISEKMISPKSVLNAISNAKDTLTTPEMLLQQSAGDYFQTKVGQIYQVYQQRLHQNNALDFDDIIFKTVEIFQQYPEELEKYHSRYQYIMVDEYQDTNHAQYELVRLLTGANGNLCVVGDDDQSIYSFRGADVSNILNFEKDYPACAVIRLEQNYRSTPVILEAANDVIHHNTSRKAKKLWTAKKEGNKICHYQAFNESEESTYVVNAISHAIENGDAYSDNAILYRVNAQSNMIERELVRAGLPYRIYGGLRFYDRMEIRDMMAYLHILVNPDDAVRFSRIVNQPKRGIGDATVQMVLQISTDLHQSILETLQNAEDYPLLARRAAKLKPFTELWQDLADLVDTIPMDELLDEILERSGYLLMLEADGEVGKTRLENIEELKTSMIAYEEENEDANLRGFLEDVSLYTDVDKYEPGQDTVMLMTVHSAKGLEFKNVYLIGMEDNIFPSARNMESSTELEEERRLAYVAITRAKENLTITTAKSRMLYGRYTANPPSIFLREIGEDCLEKKMSRALQRSQAATASYAKPQSYGSAFASSYKKKAPATSSPVGNFTTGQRVAHARFGAGTILSSLDMNGDVMLEVAFDSVGTKKLMAKYAHLTILKEGNE